MMSKIPTRKQVSAGGVAFRRQNDRVEVALISVGDARRWQLPKGLVGRNESTESTAVREVREETGIEAELLDTIDTIEYWYVSRNRGKRVRFHKYVHFYLLRYQSGHVEDHDHEVNEARWLEIDEAHRLLAFDNEKKVVARAKEMIEALA